MFTLETYDPETGKGLAYLVVSSEGRVHRTVTSCDRASHFFTPIAARVIQVTAAAIATAPLRVVDCACRRPPGR